MSKPYQDRRCTLCGRHISVNSLATSAHAKSHVRLGDSSSNGLGRYTPTPQGWAKSRATDTELKKLRVTGEAAAELLGATHYTSPDYPAVYDAYTSALHAYMEFGKD